jgi:hypothetical protein
VGKQARKLTPIRRIILTASALPVAWLSVLAGDQIRDDNLIASTITLASLLVTVGMVFVFYTEIIRDPYRPREKWW